MEWQPRETAPKDGTKILVYEKGLEEFTVTHWYVIERSHYEEIGNGLYRKIIDEPTEGWSSNYFDYWMPLPDVPIHGKEVV